MNTELTFKEILQNYKVQYIDHPIVRLLPKGKVETDIYKKSEFIKLLGKNVIKIYIFKDPFWLVNDETYINAYVDSRNKRYYFKK